MRPIARITSVDEEALAVSAKRKRILPRAAFLPICYAIRGKSRLSSFGH